MRPRKRHQLDELKKLLRDNSFPTECERVAKWCRIVKRSRPRYYHLLPIAIDELDAEQQGRLSENTVIPKTELDGTRRNKT